MRAPEVVPVPWWSVAQPVVLSIPSRIQVPSSLFYLGLDGVPTGDFFQWFLWSSTLTTRLHTHTHTYCTPTHPHTHTHTHTHRIPALLHVYRLLMKTFVKCGRNIPGLNFISISPDSFSQINQVNNMAVSNSVPDLDDRPKQNTPFPFQSTSLYKQKCMRCIRFVT